MSHPHQKASLLPALVLAAGTWAGGVGVARAADDERASFPSMSLQEPAAPEQAAPADEKSPKLPWRRFELAGGVTYSNVISSTLLSRSGGATNVEVDAENTLGLRRQVLSPDAWASYRLGDNHRIQFEFQDHSRSGSRTLEEDVELNGHLYPAGSGIHTTYGVQTFDLSYVWSFLRDARMEVGLAIHVDLVRMDFSLEAQNLGRSEHEHYLIPIPLPGPNADFALTPDLWVRERFGVMYLPLSDYSGWVLSLSVAVEYSVHRNVSIGIGFTESRMELNKTSGSSTLGDFEGKWKFDAAGVLLYLNVHF